ncbi:hypothetical protein B0A48_02695 [Cryoendolithus antarcticus]|uniref:Uncharacterized protein n=1 Tax=Cryoendolithus antarcticus TaxID=1507870 RepID=A0A1V8TL11_9PEZI|nr:hypothetical protein B0A48_02695 [Cryoendolithus antarcticus]
MQAEPSKSDNAKFAVQILDQFDLLHPIHGSVSEVSKSKLQPDVRDSEKTKLAKAEKLRKSLELLITAADSSIKDLQRDQTVQPIHVGWAIAVRELQLRSLYAPGFPAEAYRRLVAEPAALKRKVDIAVPESTAVRAESSDLADALEMLEKQREAEEAAIPTGKKRKRKRPKKRKSAHAAESTTSDDSPLTVADAKHPVWAAEVMTHFDRIVSNPGSLAQARAAVIMEVIDGTMRSPLAAAVSLVEYKEVVQRDTPDMGDVQFREQVGVAQLINQKPGDILRIAAWDGPQDA